MKCSESWLREWINPPLAREELCHLLTMAGLEVEEVAPVSSLFTHIVVGEVIKVAKHPEADRLKVCEVNTGLQETLKIVCGAENVRPGIKIPVALLGATIADKTIQPVSIRGVP